MAQFDTIRRTGSATSSQRFLVGINGTERVTFSTPIVKVAGPDKFRVAGGRRPIEQYAFKVGAKTFERFGDAAAAVLRRHQAFLKDAAREDAQEYLKLAHRILAGEVEARVIKQPEDFLPAVKEAASDEAVA